MNPAINGWAIVKDGEDAAIHAHVADLHLVGDAAEGDDGPVLKFKRHDLRRFVRSEKFIPVEMNHVVWRVGNPNFRFPCNVGCKFSKNIASKKRRNENYVCRAFLGQPFQF